MRTFARELIVQTIGNDAHIWTPSGRLENIVAHRVGEGAIGFSNAWKCLDQIEEDNKHPYAYGKVFR